LLPEQEGTPMFIVDPSTRECDGRVVVVLRGDLDVTQAARVAVELSAVATRDRVVIVDLADLDFLDSSGLAALVLARRHARDAGGDLLLAAPQRQVLRFLAVTRLIDVLAVHASVEEAARSPEQSRAAVPVAAPPPLLAVT
jgi:anti-sigma B factor antagonist